MYRWEITQAALTQRVLAIVRQDSAERAVATARTLLGAGITSLEISLTTPGATSAVAALSREYGGDGPGVPGRPDGPGAVIGAGTVLDAAAARAAVEAGARFLVCPHLEPEVIRTGHRYGVPVFPGVATAGEAVRALESGADALKLFPASALGPRWVTDVRAALPQAPLVPTGGITAERAPEWIAAGAVACGMGGSLAAGGEGAVRARVAALLARLAAAAPAPGR